jgi:hypothetical protein
MLDFLFHGIIFPCHGSDLWSLQVMHHADKATGTPASSRIMAELNMELDQIMKGANERDRRWRNMRDVAKRKQNKNKQK